MSPPVLPSGMRFLAFDLETTGLDQEKDRILEFCFIEVDASLQRLGEPFSALVDPGVPIPAKVQEITGISPALIAGRPPFSHYAPRVQRIVQDAVLIAHNHRFDVPFLHAELRRAGQPGLPVDQPCVDTATIERVVNSHALEATFRRYTGRDLEGAHRSQTDTEGTLEVLRHQIAMHASLIGNDLARLTQTHLRRLRDPDSEEREWLDHAHRFYRDASGTVRFGFGKHRDEPVHQHEGFLNWMTTRDFPEETLALVQGFLKDLRTSQTKLAA